MRRKYIALLLFIFTTSFLSAQILITGKIEDGSNQPIFNANVLAVPLDTSEKMMFTTSDENGFYAIYLSKNKIYTLTFSHISYINLNKQFTVPEQKEELDITLQDNVNALEEIVITEQAPITIKKDTTTYRVNAFTNGKERKLREVLKKLPGLEVDKNGGVTINGKKITRLLVEGKEFFYGGTKLGVNNIPADVLEEIEIIEDYHDTAFLKGLESSEDIAMNIKLLEDKKKFVFGDVEAGGGITNRYKLHPKVFKYAPKLALNAIGDINNTFQKSFTLRDYINFEGGFNLDNSSEIFNSSLSKLLRADDYNRNQHKFLGINTQYNPNQKNEFRAFLIGLKDNTEYTTFNRINYLNDNIEESRSQNESNETQLFFSKLFYNFTPNNNTVLRTEITIEKNDIDVIQQNNSTFFQNSGTFDKVFNTDVSKLNAELTFDKKFNKNHVSVFNLDVNINDTKDNTDYRSETNVFSDEIPIVDDENYNILQLEDNTNFKLGVLAKHYWVINRKNHLYFSIKNELTDFELITNDFQRLTNNQINNFEDFNNNLKSKYNYFNSQLEYKRIFNDIIAEVKLRYENLHLKNMEADQTNTILNSNVVPEFKLTWDINSKKELQVIYTTNYSYADLSRYASGRLIQGFYGIFTGNSDLDQMQSENLRLSYSYRKTYGFSFYSTLGYSKNSDIVTNNFELSEVFTSITPIQLDADNESYNTRLRFTYNKPYWRLRYGIRYVYALSNSIIEGSPFETKRRTTSNDLDFSTKFEENPNIEINANYTFADNENRNLKNKQNRFSVETTLSYDYRDFKFNTNYSFTDFTNEASFKTNSFFDNLGASIFYNKEDSLWSFELKAHNITNNKNSIVTNFGEVLVNEEQTIVFPRYVLFNITYKL